MKKTPIPKPKPKSRDPFVRYRSGDPLALPEIVAAHQELVEQPSWEFCQRYKLDREDLRQIGLEALIVAVEKFTSSRGNFPPFAKHVIRIAISNYCTRQTRSGVTIGTDSYRHKAVYITQAAADLEQNNNQPVTTETLAAALKVSPKILTAINAVNRPPERITVRIDDGGINVSDSSPDPERTLILKEALATLTDVERQVIEATVIRQDLPTPVAKRLKLRVYDVGIIKKRALAKLRAFLTDDE